MRCSWALPFDEWLQFEGEGGIMRTPAKSGYTKEWCSGGLGIRSLLEVGTIRTLTLCIGDVTQQRISFYLPKYHRRLSERLVSGRSDSCTMRSMIVVLVCRLDRRGTAAISADGGQNLVVAEQPSRCSRMNIVAAHFV